MNADRKALIRAYKAAPRAMGVAVVRHLASGRMLLLSGKDLPALLNRHRAQLRMRAHRNRALQRDWDVEGEAGFALEVLDTLKPREGPGYDPGDDLATLAALWMEKLRPYEPAGYHRRKPGA